MLWLLRLFGDAFIHVNIPNVYLHLFTCHLMYLGLISGSLNIAEIEMMKKRFAKLLLGEDLSGGGKGVSSALAISNAITNLSGSFPKSVLNISSR